MLLATVADQQIVAATPATLAWQPTNSDGEPADAGTVTVGVSSSDGTPVVAAATNTSGTGGDPRSVTLTAAQTATVDWLTATWSVASTVVASTVHEVVGGQLISRAEFARREPREATVPAADFMRCRREVDDLFRRVCRRGFVPRFAVEQINIRRPRRGLVLHYPDLRAVRWGTVTQHSGGSSTALTATQIASIPASDAGIAELMDGSWFGCGVVTLGYEFGFDRPPDDLRGAAARAIRYVLGAGNSSIPDRATTYADGQGGTTQLATPGLGPFITGIPEVDEVLSGYRWAPPVVV